MATAVATMLKPSFFVGAEQSSAVDPSSSNRPSRNYGGSSSRLKRYFVFVVNPEGANGRTGRVWKKLLPFIGERLGPQCNICEAMTSGPFHAVDITREVQTSIKSNKGRG